MAGYLYLISIVSDFLGGMDETQVSQQTPLKKIQFNIFTHLLQLGSLLWHFTGNR